MEIEDMAGSPSTSDLQASLAESAAREAHSRQAAFEASAWLAAIVENSDDAILSKTLDGIILSWNAGAEKLFGYTVDEAVGQSITIIIPQDRFHEEEAIIRQLRAGEKVRPFETVRRRKDGNSVDISLTVSPVKDATGKVLGASKIARDITPSKKAAERQALLLREMNHRVKNLFALTAALVSISARSAEDVDELADDLSARLAALSRAHALILPHHSSATTEELDVTLMALLQIILAAHESRDKRISIEGDDTPIGRQALPTFALVLHELATNAAKYGGLATAEGKLAISVAIDSGQMTLTWRETGAPARSDPTGPEGFGSRLERASVTSLNGSIERHWLENGLEMVLQFPIRDLSR
ncbi:PAS domain S-box-containing protein [Sphingomonas sp. BE270]|uniref:sensor histidine kinase n=1 Tax=Sphingomonas sp. BE270 TaxID=2817726 RepID=UPI002858B41D|nr:PAS domain S-box protein [Sphingomonas sp. BE270]MDR7260305.1 PAS domain S-box-containing protein [Sphingomonas sp. BE270]